MKKSLRTTLFAALLTALPPLHAQSRDHSGDGSGISLIASAVVAYGAILVADASGAVVVESVTRVAEGVQVVLKGVGDASSASLEFSGQFAEDFSLAAGTSGTLVATSAGHALVVSGKVIAFIPNQIGKSLFFHNRSILASSK